MLCAFPNFAARGPYIRQTILSISLALGWLLWSPLIDPQILFHEHAVLCPFIHFSSYRSKSSCLTDDSLSMTHALLLQAVSPIPRNVL